MTVVDRCLFSNIRTLKERIKSDSLKILLDTERFWVFKVWQLGIFRIWEVLIVLSSSECFQISWTHPLAIANSRSFHSCDRRRISMAVKLPAFFPRILLGVVQLIYTEDDERTATTCTYKVYRQKHAVSLQMALRSVVTGIGFLFGIHVWVALLWRKVSAYRQQVSAIQYILFYPAIKAISTLEKDK